MARRARRNRGGLQPTKQDLGSIHSLIASANKASHEKPAFDTNTVKQLIVKGVYTRERACDGKARFAQYAHATKAASDIAQRGYADFVPLEVYPCCFCGGYHLSSKKSAQHPGSYR